MPYGIIIMLRSCFTEPLCVRNLRMAVLSFSRRMPGKGIGMGKWKVGVSYERYGCITVEAETEDQAVKAAEKKLEKMTIEELDKVTEYVPDSEGVDGNFVEEML